MVAITGWMIHSLLQEANDRAARLWDGGEKKKSHCLSDKRRQAWITSTLQSVKREVSDEDIDLSSFPFLPWMVEMVGGQRVGGGAVFFFFSFSDVASDHPVGPAPPTPPADDGYLAEDTNVRLLPLSDTNWSELGSAALRASNLQWWEVPLLSMTISGGRAQGHGGGIGWGFFRPGEKLGRAKRRISGGKCV